MDLLDFARQNLLMIFVTASSGAMLAFPKLMSGAGVPAVDITQAVQMINHEDAVVLDVREHNEFQAGHIANAQHIPLGQIKDSLKALEKYRDKAIVVNCRSGSRSASACQILRKAGFTRVYNLTGGIIAWQGAQMPTIK